ncbi:MAG: hypothetical protein MPK62_13795 [Alphaproteobacteria bacterium]|nr:hypothetical protein [Alphaproteobacteria bacterium]MDA8032168.1 hypothetical protein [Alphaproteobacteria bacterium]
MAKDDLPPLNRVMLKLWEQRGVQDEVTMRAVLQRMGYTIKEKRFRYLMSRLRRNGTVYRKHRPPPDRIDALLDEIDLP